jgi:hypothetical protein
LNGTQPDAAHRTSKGVMGLPAGKHHVQLTLARTDTNETERTWARVNGAMGVLDVVVGNRTSNMTVDDTQWAAGQVELSTGWNMLEAGHSNYLNEVGERKRAETKRELVLIFVCRQSSLPSNKTPPGSTTTRCRGPTSRVVTARSGSTAAQYG